MLALASGLERTKGRREGLVEALADIGEQDKVIGLFAFDAFGDVHRKTFLVTIRDGRSRSDGQ